MNSSDITNLQKYKATYGCFNTTNYTNILISSVYASFISNTRQKPSASSPATTPKEITYDLRSIGNIDIVGPYPSSSIKIPVTGVYKVLFSAQCDTDTGNHYLEIWPVINGISVPDSNTRIKIQSQEENCLTVEYILSLNENDILQLYMIGDNSNNVFIETYPPIASSTSISIPRIPSIILTIMRIA